MPAQAPCPKCRGQFVELDRNGIKIDVCQECRGVFLDRGELDQIIAAEERAVSNVYSEDELFFRQLAGQAQPAQPQAQPAQPQAQPSPPAQPAPPAHTPPPPPVQPQYQQPPAQPAYSPPPPQPVHGQPHHQQPAYQQPPAQPSYSAPPPHHGHGHGQPHHQQYGFDLKTAERLLGDFRSHQSSHKKKHQKTLLQQLFD
jgi:Zn-finger nucleic acid-binding protein